MIFFSRPSLQDAQPRHYRNPAAFRLAALSLCACCITPFPSFLRAQATAPPPSTPRSWVEAAIPNELRIINDDGSVPLRYRIRKVDQKSDTTRIVIETRQGDVARLVERNGQPLTATEDAAERQRLNAILQSPADFIRHHKRDKSTRDDASQLVRLMPQAMLYSYAPEQPSPKGSTVRQIVIDFRSDPAFKPPTMISEALTGLAGRIWIDPATHTLTRIEGHVLKPVNFGFGFVARIFPGGSLELDQANAGGGRWVYSHLTEHLTVRAMMLKTLPENSEMNATDFQPLPAPITFQQAVQQLLATPVTLR